MREQWWSHVVASVRDGVSMVTKEGTCQGCNCAGLSWFYVYNSSYYISPRLRAGFLPWITDSNLLTQARTLFEVSSRSFVRKQDLICCSSWCWKQYFNIKLFHSWIDRFVIFKQKNPGRYVIVYMVSWTSLARLFTSTTYTILAKHPEIGIYRTWFWDSQIGGRKIGTDSFEKTGIYTLAWIRRNICSKFWWVNSESCNKMCNLFCTTTHGYS